MNCNSSWMVCTLAAVTVDIASTYRGMASRLSKQGQAELWGESSCNAGDLGLGLMDDNLMDDMFLRSSDELTVALCDTVGRCVELTFHGLKYCEAS